ncbi:MAG: hypothetical protein KKB20_03305 [Proteobacteria bacterium]|nr:hypothetical protein [Pseudomonadota bacterium]
MPDEIFGTGACGVNCMTCALATTGRCSPCGPGTGSQAARKLGAQLELLGGFCPILKCASDRKIAFCMRDCDRFPCENFQDGPYPYSEGFLSMQHRRRQGPGPQRG